MDIWVFFAIAAAAFQTVRFMFQKHLGQTALNATGATFARFAYSMPFVLLALGAYVAVDRSDWPEIHGAFLPYAAIGAVSQIIATFCVMLMFNLRNFAVGITFKKTEVLMTAIIGGLVLGDLVSPLGWIAISVGLIGVMALSDMPQFDGVFFNRILNRATGLGLLSGLFFAMSAVCYRGASLQVGSDDYILRALITLAFVVTIQAIGMTVFMRWAMRTS